MNKYNFRELRISISTCWESTLGISREVGCNKFILCELGLRNSRPPWWEKWITCERGMSLQLFEIFSLGQSTHSLKYVMSCLYDTYSDGDIHSFNYDGHEYNTPIHEVLCIWVKIAEERLCQICVNGLQDHNIPYLWISFKTRIDCLNSLHISTKPEHTVSTVKQKHHNYEGHSGIFLLKYWKLEYREISHHVCHGVVLMTRKNVSQIPTCIITAWVFSNGLISPVLVFYLFMEQEI